MAPLALILTLTALATALSPVRPGAAAALTCSDAVNALIPCGTYLLGSGGSAPSKQCCASAQALNRAAATKADRQALCECLEKTGPSFGVKPEYARQLPAFCKLQLNIPVSTNTNCSQFGPHIL